MPPVRGRLEPLMERGLLARCGGFFVFSAGPFDGFALDVDVAAADVVQPDQDRHRPCEVCTPRRRRPSPLARPPGQLLVARTPEPAAQAPTGRDVELPPVGSIEFELLARAYWAYPFDSPDRPPMLSLDYYRFLDLSARGIAWVRTPASWWICQHWPSRTRSTICSDYGWRPRRTANNAESHTG